MRQSMCNRKPGDTPWILIVSYFSTYAAKSLNEMSSNLHKKHGPRQERSNKFQWAIIVIMTQMFVICTLSYGSRNHYLFPTITNISHKIT